MTFAKRLWSAKTKEDVDWILAQAELLHGPITTKPIGGRPNNSGIIRVSSDPMLALVERITNAIDACMELRARTMHGTTSNPRDAAHLWFNIPDAGLSEMSDSERRILAQNISVTLEDSGESKRPTIVVEDRGVGLHPSEFEDTILSLNASNKIQSPYTMGTYGQGGSATLGFSRATVIVSRRLTTDLGDRPDLVGWTIAMEYFDESKMKVPSYVFYAPPNGTDAFSLDPAFIPELEHGTKITHVAYDAQRGAAAFTTGAWQILNATLFDPILPFILGGNRQGVDPEWRADHLPTRVITGTATRLAGEDIGGAQIELAHRDNHQIDLGPDSGPIHLSYWVLRRPEGSTSAGDIVRSYVEASAAVSMTLFGQRQDTMPRTWIKDQVKLPFLYKNMIVQIDADHLNGRAKRELFASTRERATESDLRRHIYEEVAEILRTDETLRFLNHEEKQRLLRKSSAATNDKVRKRLAKFVQTKLKEVQRVAAGVMPAGTASPIKPTRGVPSPPRDVSDGHLPPTPTQMQFEKRAATVRQGHKTTVWLLLNTKNGYLPANDHALRLSWDEPSGSGHVRVASRSALAGGRSSWQIAALVDAPLGEYKLRAELITPGGVLADSLSVTVAEPVEPPKNTAGMEPETGPEVVWVNKDEWEAHEFTERSVGRVFEDDESTIIFVNRDYRLLAQALSGRSLTADQISARSDRYQYPVACAVWLQNHEVQQLDFAVRPTENYLNGELERLAEAVLLASDPDVMLADQSFSED